MGCSISGLNMLYDAAIGDIDVWVNEHRFLPIKEGSFAFFYLVEELPSSSESVRVCS